jgi:hypothetical protein
MAPFSHPLPLIEPGLADFPHQMWPATFDALCGARIYVASSSAIRVLQLETVCGRHIIK